MSMTSRRLRRLLIRRPLSLLPPLLRLDERLRRFLFVLLFLILLATDPDRLLPALFFPPRLCRFRSNKSLVKSLSSDSINSQSKSRTSRRLLFRLDERPLTFAPLLRLDERLRRFLFVLFFLILLETDLEGLLPALFFILLLCLFR